MTQLKPLFRTTILGMAVVSCGQQRDTHHPSTKASESRQDANRLGPVVASNASSAGAASQLTGVASSLAGSPKQVSDAEPSASNNATGKDAINGGSKQGASGEHQAGSGPTGSDATADRDGASSASLAAICEKITRRANEKCNQQVVGLYRSSCAHYLQKSGPCGEPIRRMLECQYNAREETFCAHGADYNCSQLNRELKICQRGAAPDEQTTAEDDRSLPSGWQPIEDTQLGFTVMMPPGAALEPEAKRRTWKATDGSMTYYVAAIDAPTGKLNNQAFVRAVVAYVGSRCQLHLKLHGELEYKGTTVVQYHSACPDKTEWHGMLHFWNGKAVSTGYHAPPGETGVREPFFYSFATTK